MIEERTLFMKRCIKVLLSIVAILLAVTYVVWYFATEQMISKISEMDEFIMSTESGHNVSDISYDVSKYGFPTSVGVAFNNVQFTLNNEQAGIQVAVKSEGEMRYFVSLIDLIVSPSLINTSSHNLKLTATLSPSSDKSKLKSGVVRADVGQIKGVVDLKNKYSTKVALVDVDVYLQSETMPEEERFVTLDEVSYKGQYIADDRDMEHADGRMEIEGATFIDPEGQNSLSINKFVTDISYANMPKTAGDAVEKALSDTGRTGDVKPLKMALIDFVKQLAEKQSSFAVNSIQLETEGLNIQLSGTLSVDERYMPKGAMSMSIVADNRLKEKLPEQVYTSLTETPFGKQLLTGDAKFDFSGSIANGFAVFNGMPMLQVPPLTQMVELMPNNVNVEPTPADEPVGVVVNPELPVDDLLGHFKQEEEALADDVSETSTADDTSSTEVSQ